MPTDRYTKTVLTIIAGALVAIVAQNGIRASKAQGDQVQKVAICDLHAGGAVGCANVHKVADAFALITVSR